MKKIKSLILINILFLFSAEFSFAEKAFQTDFNSGKLNYFTLENGFSIFHKEDTTTALVRVELTFKAGFSSQTPSTAGFFPLYVNLFLSSGNSSNTISASCASDCSTFTSTVSYNSVEEVLSTLSKCASSPSFTDNSLKSEYDKMKNDVLSYASSTTGFLNSAIDSRVFYKAPWKCDSGVYPSLFTKYSLAEVRTILSSIQKNYYTPDNCAIFISGNITKEEALSLCKKYFSSWTETYSPYSKNYADVKDDSTNTQRTSTSKKYVLTDDSFSKDLTQVVVQFTSLSSSQADIVASSFTSSSSPYKKNVLEEPVLAVRSKNYLTAASAQKNGSSRLILQALLESPYSFSQDKENILKDIKALPDVPSQVDLFVEVSKKSASLSRNEFISSQNIIYSKYKNEAGNTSESMSLLADYWALDKSFSNNKTNEDFYTRFLDFTHSIQNESEKNISKAVLSEEPYIFVLVNSEVYSAQKESFEKSHYTQITKQNASWYNDELVRKNAFTNEANEKSEPVDSEEAPLLKSENFYNSNAPLFSKMSISNNIPVVVKQNAHSQTAIISIGISGGESASPIKERYLRTVLINAFARNIQTEINALRQSNNLFGETNLRAWTNETMSYITIECFKEDIEELLKASSNAILFGEIPPVVADNLVYDQKNQWSIKSSGLDFQMTSVSLNTLFGATSFGNIFDASSSILANTTYNSIELTYTELLNASIYNIVICGDVEPEKIFSYVENSFGILKEQTKRNSLEKPQPVFTNTTRKVQLRHTYTTDIDSKDAGERPETLVPTKEFYDPVQFWLQSPKENGKRAIFNALLYSLQNLIQKNIDPSITCGVQTATSEINAGCIKADKVLHTNTFLKAYKKSVKELLDSLLNNNENFILNLKSCWTEKELYKTEDNYGTSLLIQQSILCGNEAQYLEDYMTVEKADSTLLYEVAKEYILEEPVFKVYSADSKK